MESSGSIGKESERVRNWVQDILEPVVYKIEHRARVHEWFRNRTSLFRSSQDFPLNKEPAAPMPDLVAAHLGRNTPLSFLESIKARWINA